jgi:uncharacterized Zn finger protein
VVHLEISEGKIDALVRGSSMYTVKVAVAALAKTRWRGVVADCSGKIASLVELLQGKLSSGVMAVVTDRDRGLFPSPREITLSCSCPDWATMCKHVAAVMYGVGARLDAEPELLFRLRGLDAAALFTKAAVGRSALGPRAKEKLLASDSLGSVFGIDIDEGAAESRRSPRSSNSPRETGTPVPRSKRKRATRVKPAARVTVARVTITLAELARAGVRVCDVQDWLGTGDLTATRESGTYETTLALRDELSARRRRAQ